ncbi:MAG: hypothetical protein GX024_04895 [Clostridiales bacterium]|nr:hypothetical protein [Clostridiales bacterium]
MELEKITLFGTIYKLTKTEKLMQIIKDSDNVVYMASRYIIYAENKKRNLTVLDWQVTWLAVAKWISENWDIDRCLSYLADRIYYGHGYYGLKEASTGYFDKEPKDLSIEEISMLIAATTSPSYYDIRNKDEKLLNKSDEIKEMILKSKSWR